MAAATAAAAPAPGRGARVDAIRVVHPQDVATSPPGQRVLEVVWEGGQSQRVALTPAGELDDADEDAADVSLDAIADLALDAINDDEWGSLSVLRHGLGAEVREAEQALLASREEVAILKTCVKRLLPDDAGDKLDRIPVQDIPLSVDRALRARRRQQDQRTTGRASVATVGTAQAPTSPMRANITSPASSAFASVSRQPLSAGTEPVVAAPAGELASPPTPIDTILCSGAVGVSVGRVRPRRPRSADPGTSGLYLRYLKKLDRSSQNASIARLYDADVEKRRRNLLRRKENQKQALEAQWGRGTLSREQQVDLALRLCTAQQERTAANIESLRVKYTSPPVKTRTLDKEGMDTYCQRMYYTQSEARKDKKAKLWARYITPLDQLTKTTKLTDAQIVESSSRLSRRANE